MHITSYTKTTPMYMTPYNNSTSIYIHVQLYLDLINIIYHHDASISYSFIRLNLSEVEDDF